MEKSFRNATQMEQLTDFTLTNEYPLTLLLLGKIYEKRGEIRLAVDRFEAFLTV